MTLLFLLQTLLGGATEHYRAELSNFFGLDLGRLIPFNVARTWHVQLALFWVSTGFLAGGIFLLPMIAGREPPRQHWLNRRFLGEVRLQYPNDTSRVPTLRKHRRSVIRGASVGTFRPETCIGPMRLIGFLSISAR